MGGSFKHNHKIISADSKRQKQKNDKYLELNFFQTQSQENFSRQMIYKKLQNKLNAKIITIVMQHVQRNQDMTKFQEEKSKQRNQAIESQTNLVSLQHWPIPTNN